VIAATILAAGKSTRMGRPKALLRIGGRTFLQTILDTCRAVGLEGLLVLDPEPPYILSANDLSGVSVITNDEMDAGPIGSIRSAIRQVGPEVEGLLVWPVDFPLVTLKTVQGVVAGIGEATPIVTPAYEGRRGHPVLFGRNVFQELLVAPDPEGARSVVRSDPRRVGVVPVADEWVVTGVNTPADYEAMIAKTGSYY
jgi:molybdenum cofactor cytidylyltransferase